MRWPTNLVHARWRLLFAPLAGMLAACALGSSSFTTLPTRAATGVPERFVPATPPAEGSRPACASPMLDPRDDTPLVLVRSGYLEAAAGVRYDPQDGGDPGARLVGDYRVDGARYGVGPEELLRLDCRTGRPIGVVPR